MKVKCVDSVGVSLTRDKIYTVTEIGDDFYTVNNDFDEPGHYNPSRFVIYSDPHDLNRYVRCVDGSGTGGRLINGQIYKVISENSEFYDLTNVPNGGYFKYRLTLLPGSPIKIVRCRTGSNIPGITAQYDYPVYKEDSEYYYILTDNSPIVPVACSKERFEVVKHPCLNPPKDNHVERSEAVMGHTVEIVKCIRVDGLYVYTDKELKRVLGVDPDQKYPLPPDHPRVSETDDWITIDWFMK